MCDNELQGQESWVLVSLGGELMLARQEIVEMIEHCWNDSDVEWRAFVDGYPK